jgi:putative oxidoreductase
MKIAVLIARIVLGLIFLIFGINQFVQIMDSIVHFPLLDRKADNYLMTLSRAEYFFPCLKILEILCGLSLLINRFTALFLIALFPITLNMFLFEIFLGHQLLPLGITVLGLNVFLLIAYRKNYKGLFAFHPAV